MLDTSLTPLPVWGASPSVYNPHSLIGYPVHGYVSGISVCLMEIFPLCWGFGGCSHLLGVLGASAHGMSICSFLYIFVVHMPRVSAMAMIIIPPVMVVSSGQSSVSSVTVAPSQMRFAVTFDQHGVVQPPPLMPRSSGGVIGSASVPQQQPPSLMPLLAYANYAMGSPQVGFFFRVESPTILYIICLVSILVSAFYF